MFVGVDEITEIAYFSLQQVGMELVPVVADEKLGTDFLQFHIEGFGSNALLDKYPFVVTSLTKGKLVVDNRRLKNVLVDRIYFINGAVS